MNRRILVIVIVAVLVAAGVIVRAPWRRPVEVVAPRPVIVAVSGDTAGWIVPCGCASNQSGGMPRRGTYIESLQKRAAVLTLDAGGAAGGTSPYQHVKFEAILKGEQLLDLAAHNIGASEAALGAAELRRLARVMSIPWVSANLRDEEGNALTTGVRLIDVEGRRFAVTGVLAPKLTPKGLKADEPREAILRAIKPHEKAYDHLLVLAYLPEDELQALAKSLPEADAVFGGPTGQSLPVKQVGPTWLASATNKGKFLVELELPPGHPRGEWSGKVVEMDAEWPDNSAQQANLTDYLRELRRQSFTAWDTGFAPVLPVALPAGYRLAGNESCVTCHSGECKHWDGSAHAHAWQTLERKGYEADGYCQQCHTTGFGLPGGFESVERSPKARNVGCESCHGPSSEHAAQPRVKTTFMARDQCSRCHDRENSPTFQYDAFWKKIEHGAKAGRGVEP